MDGQARVSVYLELKNKLKTGLTQAKKYLNQNVQEMKGKLNELKTTHIESFRSMTDEIPGFGRAMSMLVNPVTMVIGAVTLLASAYGHASQMAREFDSRMAHANVTAQESKADLALTSAEILGIAAKSKTKDAVSAAPDAYNILLSSGLDKQTSLDTITPTLQAAKAGFTDVAIVARAAAASMNSSGIKDATRVYDILFATLNKGNAEFSDIANYLPKIIPAAKNVGLNMEQVAGAFAYLTAQGQTSERSATLLENAFKVLGDPDKVAKFKTIGVTIYDQAGKIKPLTSIIDQLNVALNGLSDENRTKVLDSLGIDMEAAGAFSALSADAVKFKETIDATMNSQGQLNKAVESASEPMDAWVNVSNQLDSMWVGVGQKVNETLGSIGEWLAPLITDWLPVIQEGFSFVWEIITNIGATTRAVVKPIAEWASKSELLRDIFTGIGIVIKGVWEVIKWITDKIEWLYSHTIKPILEAVDWVYGKVKGVFGGGDTPIPQGAYTPMSGNQAMGGLFGTPPTAAKPDALKNLYNNPEGGNSQVQDLLKKLNAKKDKGDKSGNDVSGGQQTRIITINKLSVVDGDWVSNNPEISGMDKKDTERWFEEMIQRVLVNLGRSYS